MNNIMCRYIKFGEDGTYHYCQSPGCSRPGGRKISSCDGHFRAYCTRALEDGSQPKCYNYAEVAGERISAGTEQKSKAPSAPTAGTDSSAISEKAARMGDSGEPLCGGERLRALIEERRRRSSTTAPVTVPADAAKPEPAVEAADSGSSAAKIASTVGKVLVTKTLETVGGPVGSLAADVVDKLW